MAKERSYWVIFGFSLIAGIITGLAYGMSYFGRFDLYLTRSEMVGFAFIYGIIFGALFSPLAYTCLHDKNLIVILPILYISGFLVTALLTLFAPRMGFNGFISVFVFWVLALLLNKYLAPKRRQ